MSGFQGHQSCPSCSSSDAFAYYGEEGGGHCFSCGFTQVSEEYKQEQESKKKPRAKRKEVVVKEEQEVKSKEKDVITPEKAESIKEETSPRGNGFRGIDDKTYAYFGVRHKYDEESGEVVEQYYPCTQESALTGYKIREVPKNFRSIGRTGATTECFMQFRFKTGGKYLILTEGEIDALSAYQMLKEYNTSRGTDYEIAVVSATTGAQSSKQIAHNYKFFDSFEQIIISYDNDKAGQDAIEKLVKVLPKGKIKIMQMKYKDANEYLEKGDSKGFIRAFYEAKTYAPVGVLPSSGIYAKILEQTEVPKVPFPDITPELNKMFVGGMPLGHTVNIAADTGVGKTTLMTEFVYHWIFKSPHKVGIVSMELDAGQYGEVLLSRHLSRKLALIPSVEEKLEYLRSDRIVEASNTLFIDEDGNDRFYLLDNRDGSVEEIQDTIEELVVSCGCKVIVLDPLQDILDGLTNEEQAIFMKWTKGFQKSHGVLFIYINHMRKSQDSGEQDIMGSSTIIKSASATIILKRNKLAEDPIVRNTTEILVPKNRVCGITGPAGGVYYDNQTHTMHNLDSWLNENC